MDRFCNAMIYMGSVLMIYNIARCLRLTRAIRRRAGTADGRGVSQYAPVSLLILILAGYLGVGITDTPGCAVSALLLCASVFVYLILGELDRVLSRTETDGGRLDAAYRELNRAMKEAGADRLGYFRVNLTRDAVEERGGTDLYDTDRTARRYTKLRQRRREAALSGPGAGSVANAGNTVAGSVANAGNTVAGSVADAGNTVAGGAAGNTANANPDAPDPLSREELLRQFQAGRASASEIAFCRRQSGRMCFVFTEVTLAEHPATGDVAAFITEREYDRETAREALWEQMPGEVYDFIACIARGQYTVLKDAGGRESAAPVLPGTPAGLYGDFLTRQIAPAILGAERERMEIAASLDLGRVEAVLADSGICAVDFSVNCGGQVLYKRFVFCTADREARFYVLLALDTTHIRRKQDDQTGLLLSALDEARQASAAKTTFLSNMSHDIRTPMNAIIGFTNLARQKMDDREKMQEYLDKIQASSSHLLSLINDVLEMSRIESGKIEMDEEPCSLPDILHNLHAIIVGQVEGKQQELTMDAVNVTNENIFCDKLRLNQVLLNLLSNAIKYTPSGGRVAVRIIQNGMVSDGCGAYEIHVRDNGIGMTADFAARVFDAFEREKTSTVNGIQGTGLGMAITKRIIDLMGGTIEVNTAPGEGTEFIVRVSFKVAGENQALRCIPALNGIHALVVDDDFETCDSTTNMLVQMGLRSEWTLFGKEAVLRAKQALDRGDGFGVFIIDWRLPDLDGLEAIRKIRKVTGDDARVLLMTAYDWPIIREEAIEAGVNGFCNKPLFMSELRSALVKVMGGANGEAGLSGDADDSDTYLRADFAGKRLLLVEDMPLNREIATTILGMSGFQVEEVENGAEAVEMVKISPPGYYDAVLMDVQMPVMDGYEATRAIRALPDKALAGIPIIAMTANAFDEDKKAALSAGMNGHIAKPIDVEQLMGVLGKLLLPNPS